MTQRTIYVLKERFILSLPMNLPCWPELNESSKNILKPEEINRLYNDYRHAIHLKNGYKKSSLIDDDIDQTIYPRNPGKMRMLQSIILEALESYTSVLVENKETYEALMEKIFATLDTQSVIIVTNHATFAGIPILISQLHKYSKIHHKKEARENINTIVGPALLTQSQKKIIQSISTLRKTIPTTNQSDIPAFNKAIENNQLAENPIQKIRKDFVKNFIKKWTDPGNIFLVAPTGTRDILERSPYKTIQSISYANDETLQHTLKMINYFVQQGNMIILAGVNETSMKIPSKTHEKNNSRSKWSTYITLKELTPETCEQLIKDKIFMNELALLVKDNYGNSIGKALPKDQLKEQEKIARKKIEDFSDPLHEDYEFKDYTFVDSIKKKIIRKIFDAIKDH